jgi:hypothetical protein
MRAVRKDGPILLDLFQRNPNIEIRNPKQARGTKKQKGKTPPLRLPSWFSAGFGLSNLFRISDFGFRNSHPRLYNEERAKVHDTL